jgi:hypothetical protein
MNIHRTNRLMTARVAASCLAALLSSGCAYSFSSLATNTGPRPHGGEWSVANPQWVHVGEKIDVSYALQSNIADYAVLTIEPLGKSKVSLAADRGRFIFDDIRLSEPTPPNHPLVLRAAAYRERNERDVMDLDGRLLRRESPFDVADQKVASATLKLYVYQTNLAIQVPPDPAGYKWETGKLLLYADPERPAEIRLGRDYRKGFRVEGPTATGTFVVAYEPAASQVKRTDSTRVVFAVLNAAGNEHRQEVWVPTP